jgi:WD40 repeat protein
MADVFISYSRKDIAFARLLHQAFEDNNFETWIDWQDIPPSAAWLAEVCEAIEKSDTFVFIISQTSIESEICNLEISHAVKNNKRLIPIVIDETDPKKVTPELAALNWLYFRRKDKFSQAFQDLIDAIQTDYAWVKGHTRLQVRALEWEYKDHEKGFLLRGRDLEEAEEWLAQAAGKDPQPTALQNEYLTASRQAAIRRKRMTVGGAVIAAAIIIAAVLTITIIQAGARRQKEAARQTAASQQLAEESAKQLDNDLGLSLLLSMEATQAEETIEARSSLLDALGRNAYIEAFLTGQDEGVQCMAFSPDGTLLATGGCLEKEYYGQERCLRGGVFLWDVQNHSLLDVLEADLNGNVMAIAFSPDGRLLAVGGCHEREVQAGPIEASVQGAVELWDVSTRERIGDPLVGHRNESADTANQVENLAFSPDGRLLAASGMVLGGDGWQGSITLWDVEGMKTAGDMLTFGEDISGLAFSPRGDWMAASSSFENTVGLWPIIDGGVAGNPVIWMVESPQELDFSPNEDILAVSHGESDITIYNVPDGNVVCEPPVTSAGIGGPLSFSADGRYLVASGTGGERSTENSFTVWDMTVQAKDSDEEAQGNGGYRDAEVAYELQSGTPFQVTEAVFSPEGYRLATGSLDGSVILWDLEKHHPLAETLAIGLNSASSAAFSPDGSVLASGHNNLELWDLKEGMKLDEVPVSAHGGGMTSLAFSPDGEMLIAGTFDWGDNVALWDIVGGEPIAIGLEGHTDECFSVDFSPNGDVAASSSLDGTIIFWDPQAGTALSEPLTDIPAAEGSSFRSNDVWSIVFTPDGSTLASGRGGGDILMWDVAEQRPRGEAWPAHDGGVMALAVSPRRSSTRLGRRRPLDQNVGYGDACAGGRAARRTQRCGGRLDLQPGRQVAGLL